MENLGEIVGMRLPRFSRMPGNQYPIDGVGPIEGSLIFGIGEDGTQHRLDVLQRRSRKILLFGDRAQHSTGIHGAKVSQPKFPTRSRK